MTAGRQDDLAEAERQVAERHGDTVGDLTFDNVGPIRDVALRIVNALGWWPCLPEHAGDAPLAQARGCVMMHPS